jgi:hypothetical protein
MSEQKELLTTNRKALTINLDEPKYGTFAEIGAGQEVARVFFQSGGASGTIAKTISAYDMTFSDAIYGKAPRYVSRERLGLMLDHDYMADGCYYELYAGPAVVCVVFNLVYSIID